MYRLFLSMVVMLLIAGCSGESADSDSAGGDASIPSSDTEPAEGTGTQRIPDEVPPATSTEGIELALYGDESGSVTELAVTPGETFDIYMMALVEGTIRISAAQYRLELPDGITIFAEHKIIDRSMTIGDALENFNIAFRCVDPGIIALMRYTLESSDDFSGGEISVLEGIPPDSPAFRGIVTCPDDGRPLKLPAEGRSLVLTIQ